MDGLLFVLSVIGVGLVMWWLVKNDSITGNGSTMGLFAMRDPAQAGSEAQQRAPAEPFRGRPPTQSAARRGMGSSR